MKRQSNFKLNPFTRSLKQFTKEQKGVYSILMAGIGATLIGVIAFAVDGSGIILDKARLSDSLEQASLTLTAENNTFRQDPYKIPKSKQKERDEEIVESYVKGYMPQVKTWTPDIIKCQRSVATAHNETINCYVSGSIVRDAWLPLKFANTAKEDTQAVNIYSASNAEKHKESPPLDIMLVADFSGSMNFCVHNYDNKTCIKPQQKRIYILREVLKDLTNDVIFKEKNTLNRVGITSFSMGAQHPGNLYHCVLPYQFHHRDYVVPKIVSTFEDSRNSYQDNILKLFAPYVDLEKTIAQINKFDGSVQHYQAIYKNVKRDRYSTCVGHGNKASAYWYSNAASFNNDVQRIQAEGGTLISSGLLVGANLMMDRTKHHIVSNVKNNTKRIIVVLSDGKDELLNDSQYYSYKTSEYSKNLEDRFRSLTRHLIERGMCNTIRTRLDSLQDKKYTQHSSKIVFIAFGYNPDQTNETAWKKCVGNNNYFVAHQRTELLAAFKQALTSEEVGHSTK